MANYEGPPAAVFIADMPNVEYRGANVHLTYRSGGHAFERVMTRAIWRGFIEREIRKMNDVDRAEQGRVATLRPAAGHRAPKRANGGEGGSGADHAA